MRTALTVCVSLIISGIGVVFAANETKTSASKTKSEKASHEPICVVIEPAVLKTDASHDLSGARQTVLSPAAECVGGVKLLSSKEWGALGLTWENYLAKATLVAAKHLATIIPELHKDSRGTVEYVKLQSDRHLTSSVILCPELWKQFSPMLGTTLLAVVPDRFTVYLFPRQSGAFVKQGPEVAALFKDATYPASAEAFEISETSFKSIGDFDTRESE